jgi:hypothetical protein
MKRRRLILATALLSVLALAVASSTRTQADGAHAYNALAEYAIDWFTIDGGGTMFSSSSEYTLGGTIGQPDTAALGSGEYALSGGFWAGAAARYTVALPVAAR